MDKSPIDMIHEEDDVDFFTKVEKALREQEFTVTLNLWDAGVIVRLINNRHPDCKSIIDKLEAASKHRWDR